MTISDDDMARLDAVRVAPAMAKLGAMMQLVVEDALAPVLNGKRKQSCLHILDDGAWRMLPGETTEHANLRPLLCPQHPERLLCNTPGTVGGTGKSCLALHYEHEHGDEARRLGCFVCEMPAIDELTGEFRDDFEGITAKVTLHRNIPFLDDNRRPGTWWQFGGVLVVLPVAHLCPRHSEVAGELPWRMGWPMGEH